MGRKTIIIGWVAALIMAIWIVLGGLVSLIVPDLFLSQGFKTYTGQSWPDFASASPKLAELYRINLREVGFLALSIGALVIGVALAAYRKGERWAWFTFLVAGIFGWGGVLATSISSGKTLVLMLGIIGTLLFAIAILVPARDILGRK
jgi:hypothetical protein